MQKNKAMAVAEKFNPRSSIKRAKAQSNAQTSWCIEVPGGKISWASSMDRIVLIRKGLPYESLEVISARTALPVKRVLDILNIPQTTYNKRKRDKALLNPRDSEIVLLWVELLDFGVNVFNNESEKFQRWLKKSNVSLGGAIPESLFDSVTGIQEVRNSLNRLEYGNMA